MVVDDSAVIRGLLTRFLEADPAISVVASVSNGQMALDKLDRTDVEIVVLDIEMPVMDGMTALPLILKKKPGIQVLMASTLTRKNAEVSLRALSLGAADYVPKPSSTSEIHSADAFKNELTAKVKALAEAGRGGRGHAPRPATAGPAPAKKSRLVPCALISLRRQPVQRPDLIAIGSSTGGPKALMELLPALPGDLPAALLVVQHLPAGFTESMAQRLDAASQIHVKEARSGDIVEPGQALVAAGGYHMTVDDRGRVELTDDPPQHGVRPSIDVTMETVARAYGKRALGVVLTGMGSDGTRGAGLIRAAGGRVAAEHESSCVVYEMPKSVVEAGYGDFVVPIQEMPRIIEAMCGMREPALAGGR